MLEDIEIRKLKEGTLYAVVQILDINDDWKKFMSLIPMDPQKENSDLKYNNEDVRLIEEYSKIKGEKCAQILFEEWGTSGQIRPTLRTVKQIALKADMMRVADEVAHLLGEPPPPRPTRGPGAPVTDIMSNSQNEINSENEIRDTTAQIESEPNGTNHTPTQSTTNMPNWQVIQRTRNYQSSDHSQSDNQQSDTETSNSDSHQFYYQQSNNQTSADQHSDSQTSDQPSDNQQSDYQHSLPNIPIFQSTTENVSLSSRIDRSILQDTNLTHFDYNELQAITSNFSDAFKIGTGGFGEVFKAPHPTHGLLAIKKTHIQFQHKQEVAIKIFNSEVKYLSQFRHENIVPILGFSKNGPVPCIVCEYIGGGSLYGKLAERTLTEGQRLAVMRGTAEGLRYLHSYKVERTAQSAAATDPSMQSVSKTNFVHGDVKTANILLTKDFIPKLCDFGLAKQYDQTFITPNVMGTSVYMAPEALHGTVTQKSDIYSFGIVLLELLTGLRPLVVVIDPTSEIQTHIQIKLYVDESIKRYGKTIRDLLDQSAGEWTRGDEVFALAKKCYEYDRHDRPTSEHICNVLRSLQDY